jgi:hypothetical protein
VPDGDRGQGSEAPALSVVTVTHNHGPFLGALLDSLEAERASLPFEVIVVDNVSDDESAAIAGRRPWVTLLRNATRAGFSANNNRAVRVCRGRHVLLLNPDTEVRPGALRIWSTIWTPIPTSGSAVPNSFSPTAGCSPPRGRFPTLGWVLVRRTPLRLLIRDSVWSRRHLMEDAETSVVREVDWLLGAALAVRRDLLRTVGLLDEGLLPVLSRTSTGAIAPPGRVEGRIRSFGPGRPSLPGSRRPPTVRSVLLYHLRGHVALLPQAPRTTLGCGSGHAGAAALSAAIPGGPGPRCGGARNR